jgi:hypothetical protein
MFSPQERAFKNGSDFISDSKSVSLGKTDDGEESQALVNNL